MSKIALHEVLRNVSGEPYLYVSKAVAKLDSEERSELLWSLFAAVMKGGCYSMREVVRLVESRFSDDLKVYISNRRS